MKCWSPVLSSDSLGPGIQSIWWLFSLWKSKIDKFWYDIQCWAEYLFIQFLLNEPTLYQCHNFNAYPCQHELSWALQKSCNFTIDSDKLTYESLYRPGIVKVCCHNHRPHTSTYLTSQNRCLTTEIIANRPRNSRKNVAIDGTIFSRYLKTI